MLQQKSKWTIKSTLAVLALTAGVTTAVIAGCSDSSTADLTSTTTTMTESRGEHGSGGEGGSESGGEHGNRGEGSEGGAAGSEEGSGANALALDQTFDTVRAGARLIMNYDAANNAFVGTVENTTNATLTRVRH